MSLEYSLTVELLTEYHLDFLSLTGGCTGLSESTLVKMPHFWKFHVVAHLYFDPLKNGYYGKQCSISLGLQIKQLETEEILTCYPLICTKNFATTIQMAVLPKVKTALCAASQLPGEGPTYVEEAIAPAH